MYKFITILCILPILFWGCDDLEVDPQIDVSNCTAGQKDKDNYALLMANEKQISAQIDLLDFDPNNVEPSKKDSLLSVFSDLNINHETYRKGFSCQYWGTNSDFLNALFSIDATKKDLFMLEPENYKALFKITSNSVKKAINQEDWIKEDVYIFPGISRVPWEDSSPEATIKVIDKINTQYNNMRVLAGLEGNVQLFKSTDHLFPHATFHQVYVDVFISNLKNNSNLELHQEMTKTQIEISKRFIMRAPNSIE